jgi:aldehyde:ferredoxin oxidoreductase
MQQSILKINLSSGTISTFTPPRSWEADYLGGASLAARLLYDSLTPEVEALSPQAPLLFLNGPLSGTAGPAVGRFVVCARSPLTGLWGEANCGGFWGVELRKSGFAGLWVEGSAGQPVWIWIRDGLAEIRPAGTLWGLDTYQAQEAVLKELGEAGLGASVAAIGPAGENLIPYALILTDHGRVAGRTGMGAVMGSKNLKAIAVRGRGKIPLAQPDTYNALRAEVNRGLRNDPTSMVLRELGTAGVVEYFDYLSEMPKRYFQGASFSGAEKISGGQISSSILAGISACQACVIACGRVVRLPGEPEVKRKGPEYETLVGFGPNLLIDDPVFITRIGELCDRYGMDTISLSNTIGLAFKLFERGLITAKDTGGLNLQWGDHAAVELLVHQVVQRQGLGEWIALGALAMARRFGAEEEAVQVKGLEAAYHDPRGATGMALVYATSPLGASHNHSDYFLADIGQVEPALGLKYFDRLAGSEKAANVAIHQDWRTVFNALVMCLFANVDPLQVLGLVNAACGCQWELPDLLLAGERAWNLKRVINHRLGLRRGGDSLPKSFRVPYADNPPGVPEGFTPDFDSMLQAYYSARGWDARTGFPTPQKLESLGLGWAIPDLDRIEKEK